MQRKSTRQLLKKIPGFPCLYRHDVNEIYYGITKVLGNRKEHSLGTTDRKLAERNLKAWLQDLAEIEPGKARKTVGNLLEDYQKNLAGKKVKTRQTRMSILKKFRETWRHGERVRASSVTTHQLNEWLAQHEGRLKNSTYNEYARFLKDLFEIAVDGGLLLPPACLTWCWFTDLHEQILNQLGSLHLVELFDANTEKLLGQIFGDLFGDAGVLVDDAKDKTLLAVSAVPGITHSFRLRVLTVAVLTTITVELVCNRASATWLSDAFCTQASALKSILVHLRVKQGKKCQICLRTRRSTN